ncbi:LPS O-antigen length regulator [Spongiibacter sp. KMU-158]|uniref:LPS O-antigen length regulator n=1 Tax=Spongiibacter pelagi TaxID=2760804 RepID=A0A927GXC4_9GAMM|nr:Wzz/FepE/Etk N-terminal domain-containing protein [Spongiibacter pelagi]MBD2859279.1 LPS O-antigen length regulator [Spongiibacter pelagi]
MEERMPQPYYQDDEIDLKELFLVLWKGKFLIIAITAFFAVAGVIFALMKPNVYQSSALVAPAQDGGGAGRLSGQLGGLASLAGISLGGGNGSDPTVVAKEILQSRAFLADFIHRHQLEVSLMAATGWNLGGEVWELDQEIYSRETGSWQLDDDGKSLEPTDWDMVKKFKGLLSVSESKDTGMVTIAIKSLSPVAAKDWVQKLVKDINEHMRAQDIEDAEARIGYLEKKLSETNIAGMQQVFYQLIESETRTVMLANAQPEYVFKTIDPAVVPQEKSEPKRALIAAVATVLGGMLGVLVVLVRHYMREGRGEV